MGGHGRKGSYRGRLARPVNGAVPAFRAFFAFRPERGAGNQPTNPDTMLRPYIPQQTKFCIIDGKSVRVCAPSFARTGTPAVDNNPASKAPESGNGGPFPEVGAEHLNSSRRSRVTCFSSAVPHPFFHPYFKRSTNHLGQGPSGPPPHNPVRRSFATGDIFQSTSAEARRNAPLHDPVRRWSIEPFAIPGRDSKVPKYAI